MKVIVLSVILLFMYPGKRQVLLFYNENGVALKDKQLTLLNEDKKGLQGRDIIIRVYKTAEEKATADKWKVNTEAGFTFLLIGKDGGEKMRTDSVVSLAQLYKTIDAMPMRREEIKEQN